MDLQAFCFKCATGSGPTYHDPIYFAGTLARWFVVPCPRGHDVGIIIRAPGWARLYERGLERIAAGVLREAVLDCYTAFEMYVAEVPAHARYDREIGASPNKLREETRSAVKRIENAIGAACAVASLVGGKPAPTWSTKKTVEVRNDAAHAGVYPSEEQATECALEIARTIVAFESLLAMQACVNEADWPHAVLAEEIAEFRRAYPNLEPSYVSSSTVFAVPSVPPAFPTPDDVRARIDEYQRAGYAAGLVVNRR